MKKIAFVFVLLALGFVCYAGGGPGKARKPAYVPKHEFSIQGSGSYNTIFLSKTGSEKIERVKFVDYNNKKYGPLFPAGFEYTYHFDSHWGITTGLGLSHHPYFNEGSTGTHTVVNTGTFSMEGNPNPTVYREYTFANESQEFVLDYITIPILGQYMLPVGKGFHFYAQAGFRLGILLAGYAHLGSDSDSYSVVSGKLVGNFTDENRTFSSWESGRSYIRNEWQLYHSRTFGGDHPDDNTNYFRAVNLYTSLEAGFRIPIYGPLGLYAGGFVDVGMIRPIPARKHIYPVIEDGNVTSVPPLEMWCAREDVDVTTKDGTYTVTADQKPFLKSIVPFSAGFKFKIAF